MTAACTRHLLGASLFSAWPVCVSSVTSLKCVPTQESISAGQMACRPEHNQENTVVYEVQLPGNPGERRLSDILLRGAAYMVCETPSNTAVSARMCQHQETSKHAMLMCMISFVFWLRRMLLCISTESCLDICGATQYCVAPQSFWLKRKVTSQHSDSSAPA